MPGTSVAYRYSALNTENVKFLTTFLIVFNILYVILGSLMIGCGLFILLETDFRRWIHDLGLEHYWTGVYILLVAGALTMLQTFFGLLGAYQKKRTMLLIFAVSLVICIVLEITGATYLLKNGIRFSAIEVWLKDRFLELISQSDYNDSSKRTMSIIQEWVGCCGADGVYDYVNWNKVIPNTCFDPINGNAWYRPAYGYVGCVRGFTFYIESRTGWMAGLALCLAFFQLFALAASLMLSMAKMDFKSKSNLNLNR